MIEPTVTIFSTGKRAFARVQHSDGTAFEPELPFDLVRTFTATLRRGPETLEQLPTENPGSAASIFRNEFGYHFGRGQQVIDIPDWLVTSLDRIADGKVRIDVAASREYEADRDQRIAELADIDPQDSFDGSSGDVQYREESDIVSVGTETDDAQPIMFRFERDEVIAFVESYLFGPLPGDSFEPVHGEAPPELDSDSPYAPIGELLGWHAASREALLRSQL